MKTKKYPLWDVIILGAGASGLMCASVASARGLKVLIIDHAPKIARKVSIAGGGKANITNLSIQHTDYVGNNPQFARSALSRFSPTNILQTLSEQAIPVEEREHGQIFCKRSAEDIISLLSMKTSACEILLNTKITGVHYKESQCQKEDEEVVGTDTTTYCKEKETTKNSESAFFEVTTDKQIFTSHSLVIATGSPAWPQIGATDAGMRLAKQFGHKVAPWQPALVGLTMQDRWIFSGLEGISLNVDITILPQKREINSFVNSSEKKNSHKPKNIVAAKNLSLLFTHRGISGPAVLQASLYYTHKDTLSINLLPRLHMDDILQHKENGKKLLKTVMTRLLPHRLAEKIIPQQLMEKKIAEIASSDRKQLVESIHNCLLIPTGTEGMKKAEVAKGGIRTEEISSKTMESHLCKGLFFCGEVLDITGRLGGYNLHWAWASGTAAGQSV